MKKSNWRKEIETEQDLVVHFLTYGGVCQGLSTVYDLAVSVKLLTS